MKLSPPEEMRSGCKMQKSSLFPILKIEGSSEAEFHGGGDQAVGGWMRSKGSGLYDLLLTYILPRPVVLYLL